MGSYIVRQGEADHLYTMYSNPTYIVSIPYNATMEEYQISFQSYPQHILKNH